MKKLLVITIFLLAVTPRTYSSEDAFQLQPAYLPNKTYHITFTQESAMLVDLKGEEKTKRKFTPPGLEYPIKGKENIESLWILETGQRENDGSLLLKIKLEQGKKTREGGNEVIPFPDPLAQISGIEIHGKILSDGNIIVQEFKGAETDEAMKETYGRLIFEFMKGPRPVEKSLKVGDEFTQEIFQKLPTVGGPPLDLRVTTTYQLNRIKNGKAYFKTEENCSLVSPPAGFTGKLDGYGSGTMVYDIALSLVTYWRNVTKMTILLETPDFSLINEATSKQEGSIRISQTN